MPPRPCVPGASGASGFITTNSIKQTFNRRVVQAQLDAKNLLTLAFAIPDHPGRRRRRRGSADRDDGGDGGWGRRSLAPARQEPTGENEVEVFSTMRWKLFAD